MITTLIPIDKIRHTYSAAESERDKHRWISKPRIVDLVSRPVFKTSKFRRAFPAPLPSPHAGPYPPFCSRLYPSAPAVKCAFPHSTASSFPPPRSGPRKMKRKRVAFRTKTFGQVRLSVDARLGTRRTAFSGRSLILKPTTAGEWIAPSRPGADALSTGRTRRCVVRCNTHPRETLQRVLIAGIPHGTPVRLSNA